MAYAVEGFESVWAETGIVPTLRQGPFSVSARSEHGDLSRLHVDLRGSTLSLSSDAMLTMARQPTYKVTVSAPRWSAIEASAGVLLNADDLAVEDLKVDASTGVRMKLSGSCGALEAKASAGASIDASDLKCTAAAIAATGGARVQAFASEEFHGAANAGAVIDISGNPPTVEKDADISGVITLHSSRAVMPGIAGHHQRVFGRLNRWACEMIWACDFSSLSVMRCACACALAALA